MDCHCEICFTPVEIKKERVFYLEWRTVESDMLSSKNMDFTEPPKNLDPKDINSDVLFDDGACLMICTRCVINLHTRLKNIKTFWCRSPLKDGRSA